MLEMVQNSIHIKSIICIDKKLAGQIGKTLTKSNEVFGRLHNPVYGYRDITKD